MQVGFLQKGAHILWEALTQRANPTLWLNTSARTVCAIAPKSFLVDAFDFRFEDKAQAHQRALAMASASPQSLVEGEVGPQGVRGTLLAPIADTSAYRNIRDQVPDSALLFDIADAIDQPILRQSLPHVARERAASD